MAEGTVVASVVRALLEVAVTRGADRRALLAEAEIDAGDLEDDDARVPLDCFRALIRAGQRLSGDPALALHYGEAIDLSEVSLVGLIGQASATMLDAFRQLQRYSRLNTDLDTGGRERFELVQRGADVWLVDNRVDADGFFEHSEIAFAQMVTGCRAFGVDPFAHEARFTHPDPGYRDEYERILRAPVAFGCAENAMRLEQRFLHHPIAVQPRYVFGILSEHADALLRKLDQAGTVRGRVESLLMPALHTGAADIEAVARQMGVGRQTLYRRLKAEGCTFRDVLDALRRRLAMDYIEAGKVSVHEAAYLVGFSDPAAFSRAFKRWTGTSPRDFRMAAASGRRRRRQSG